MTRDELLEKLRSLEPCAVDIRDPERGHVEADKALLAYINDPEITKAYRAIDKWYA